MAQIALGYITPGATGPIRLTNNRTDPTLPVWCHKYRIWPLSTNAGQGYVGNANMLFFIGTDMFGIIANPALGLTQVTPYYESEPVEEQQNPIDLAGVWLDADNPADSFLITGVEA